jgi:MarR family transcriptional regulator, organic hydroperoxide resistance regulator
VSQHFVPEVDSLALDMLDIIPSVLRHLYTDVVRNKSLDSPEWRELSKFRVTTNQLAFLHVLVQRERCSMQEIADLLYVTSPTITAMVKRMLALGYVERAYNVEDWRMIWIVPTELGRHVVSLYERERLRSLKHHLSQLNNEDCQLIARALPALRRIINTSEPI